MNNSNSQTRLLEELGILPPGDATFSEPNLSSERLQNLWTAHADRNRSSKNTTRIIDFIAANSSSLRLQLIAETKGKRLLVWPFGKPGGERLVGFVTSRLGRKLDERDDWFQRLRLACAAARREDAVIVAAQDSAGFEFIARSAALFELPILRIVTNDRISPSRWFAWVVEQCSELQSDACWPVFVSPPIDSGVPDDHPIQDRVVSMLADQLWVLSLRKNGNWHQLIQRRLNDQTGPFGSVRLIDGDASLSKSFAQDLHAKGAVRWCLTSTQDHLAEHSNPKIQNFETKAENGDTAEFLRQLNAGEKFLTHWTRRTTGLWPGETKAEFLDGYILSESPDRSAFGTLKQIARDRKLRASSDGIRAKQPVISFTAVPLPELSQRRSFQTHRNRWDFELYGVCISSDLLETDFGVRAVIYGDNDIWSNLPDIDQPFFQQASSETPSGQIDWTQEKESRHVGDLDLATIPSDRLFLFVATNREAALLRQETDARVVSFEELADGGK
jgi:hypothetical protein